MTHITTMRLARLIPIASIGLTAAGANAQVPAIPVRQMTTPEAVSAEPLGLVLGARRMSDGRLLVNDGGRRRLVVFDSSLKTASIVADTLGTSGLNYGGAASPTIAYLGDSTLFLDRAARAFIVLNAAGKQARLAALPKTADQLYIGGSRTYTDPAGRLVYRGGPVGHPVKDSGQRVLVIRLPDSASVVRANFETRTVDTIGRVKLPLLQENHNERLPSGTTKQTVITFARSWADDWAMTPDGTIAIVRGQDYHIDWFAPDGTRSSTPKMPLDWHRISDEDKHRIADSAAKETQAFIDSKRALPAPPPRPDGTPAPRLAIRADIGTGALQIMSVDATAVAAPPERIPDFEQPFRPGTTLADPAGRIWILPSYSKLSHGGLVYDVVDRRGTIVERVELPPGRSIAGFGSGDQLYLAYKDGDAWRLEIRRIAR